MKITFLADDNKQESMQALRACMKRYGQADLDKADVVVVLGGDGFMLKTLHQLLNYQTPVFGLNLGHVGYLLNHFSLDNIPDRIETARATKLSPLKITAEVILGKSKEMYAFNEVAFGRTTPQAARLEVFVTDENIKNPVSYHQEVLGDGLIVATNIGSHGYYESAKGKKLPKNKKAIGVQAICSKTNFNHILSEKAEVCVMPQEIAKRPVHVDIDGKNRLPNIKVAYVEMDTQKCKTLLKDKQSHAR